MNVQSLTEPQILAQTYTELERRFTSLDDLAHGWEHVERVYKIARYIAEREGADSFIVGMAALMHDLGRTVSGTHEHHADLSITLANDIMNTYAISKKKQQAIRHAILTHSFSKGIEPQTLEAQVVRDADRLDGLGAIGIMRWAITGAIKRTPTTRPYDPEDPFAERHIPDDKQYILDHFFTKLLKLEETMTTETGKLMAQRRTGFMRTYLHEFKRELDLA